jgi:hypothetical protein
VASRALLATCLFFDPEDGSDMSLRNMLTFNGLHGVISLKIELLISIDVRTSNSK